MLNGRSILYVVQPNEGGAPLQVSLLSEQLAKLGVRISVACDPANEFVPSYRAAGEVIPIPMNRNPSPGDLRAIRGIKRLTAMRPFDLVHAHSSKAGMLARVACGFGSGNPPVLYTPHSLAFDSTEFGPARRGGFWMIEWMLGRRTKAILGLTEREIAQCQILAGSRTAVFRVANGVPAMEVPLSRGPVARFGFVGRLAPQKGVDVLIKAWRTIEQRCNYGTLDIIGDGPQREYLENLSVGLKRIQFLGHLPNAGLLMRGYDAIVIPSRWEANPFVLIEAMNAARPVVATSVGISTEWIRSGVNGILVDPDDPAGLAVEMLRLMRDPERAKNLGLRGRGTFEMQASIERMVDDHVRVYEEVLGQTAPS